MTNAKYIIKGDTCHGEVFRPSDWVDRLATMFATYDRNHRLRYIDGVRPCYVNDERCLQLDCALRNSHPSWFEYILQFADDNDLCVETV